MRSGFFDPKSEEHVEFLFNSAAPDGGELQRWLGSAQVAVGLDRTQKPPFHGRVKLPPAQLLRVGSPSSNLLVSLEKLLTSANSRYRQGGSEAPYLGTQPPEIFDGVAPMD